MYTGKLLNTRQVLRLLKNKDIDRDWWDEIIASSPLNDPYPYSWYLDIMCQGWQAYYDDEVNAVMPVPGYRKALIHYIHTPSFIQRLGIYSPGSDSGDVQARFLARLTYDFPLVDLCIHGKSGIPEIKYSSRNNYYLDLGKEYKTLYNSYTAGCKRDVKLAKEANPDFVSGIPSGDAIDLFIKGPGRLLKGLSRSDYQRLQTLMEYCRSAGLGEIVGVYKDKSLIYSLFYIKHAGKITALFISTSMESRIRRSGYFIINHLLEEFAGSARVYDFAGSELKGVKKFILSFGSAGEEYFNIYSNRLLPPLKQLVEYRRKRANR